MKRRGLFWVVALFGFIFSVPCRAELPRTETQTLERDPYGAWRRSRSFERVSKQGIHVVDMPEERTFFAYYVPPGYKPRRVLVSVHGTGGTPYESLKDEIPWSAKFGYLPVAISWFSPEEGFLHAKDLYRNILQALSYIRDKTGDDLSSVGYIGFSRGAAISYEVAYIDAKSEKLFDLVIAHSGGVPRDFRVEALKPGSAPDNFFAALAGGSLGPEALKGERFFLYSGDKDEQWGPSMSDKVGYAKQLIEQSGGEVVEWVRDPEGGHAGFIKTRAISEKAFRHFIRLTGG